MGLLILQVIVIEIGILMNILIYIGLGIGVFFGLGIIMYYVIFKNPTFLHDIEIKENKPQNDTPKNNQP